MKKTEESVGILEIQKEGKGENEKKGRRHSPLSVPSSAFASVHSLHYLVLNFLCCPIPMENISASTFT